MIEVPRAAVTADEIASEAEFFSFGTNDLTQTTFAFSRDDAGKFIRVYMETKVNLNGKQVEILEKDPFSTLDTKGVGEFMKIAIEKGRKTRPNLKVGICGEHGGDPASIEFCHRVGMNYVSCSPYRVPIARLAAARVVLKDKL
jgi:pyruvate,orthophosphate dikinase